MDRYNPSASVPSLEFTTQDINATGRRLTTGLRDLYKSMSETLDVYDPSMFLQVSPSAPPISHSLTQLTPRCSVLRSPNLHNEVAKIIPWPNKTPKNAGLKSFPFSVQTSKPLTKRNLSSTHLWQAR